MDASCEVVLVHDDARDVAGHDVAHAALGEIALAAQETGLARLRCLALDDLPLLEQVIEVGLEGREVGGLARGAHDDAHALRHVELAQQLAHAIPLRPLRDATGDARARRERHQHQVATGERDASGERRSLATDAVARDLHDHLVAGLDALRDFELRLVLVAEREVGRVQEAGDAAAEIDERGTDATLDVLDAAAVDVAGRGPLGGGQLDVDLLETTIHEQRDARFVAVGRVDDEDLLAGGLFGRRRAGHDVDRARITTTAVATILALATASALATALLLAVVLAAPLLALALLVLAVLLVAVLGLVLALATATLATLAVGRVVLAGGVVALVGRGRVVPVGTAAATALATAATTAAATLAAPLFVVSVVGRSGSAVILVGQRRDDGRVALGGLGRRVALAAAATRAARALLARRAVVVGCRRGRTLVLVRKRRDRRSLGCGLGRGLLAATTLAGCALARGLLLRVRGGGLRRGVARLGGLSRRSGIVGNHGRQTFRAAGPGATPRK